MTKQNRTAGCRQTWLNCRRLTQLHRKRLRPSVHFVRGLKDLARERQQRLQIGYGDVVLVCVDWRPGGVAAQLESLAGFSAVIDRLGEFEEVVQAPEAARAKVAASGGGWLCAREVEAGGEGGGKVGRRGLHCLENAQFPTCTFQLDGTAGQGSRRRAAPLGKAV